MTLSRKRGAESSRRCGGVEQWRTLHRDELLADWELAQEPTSLNPIVPLRRIGPMAELARVAAVEHLGARVLRIEFTDAVVREIDFVGALPGILAGIDDDDVFSTVSVDQIAGTVSWPNGVDLDPDVLRGVETASAPGQGRLLREYRLESAS